MEKLIAPSILNVSSDKREETILKLMNLGIKWFHYDVIDNEFVPNSAITIEEIKNFYNKLPRHSSDVHLMVNDPFEYAKQLYEYTTCITVHYESFKSDQEIIEFVNRFSMTNWVGLALKPSTKFEQIKSLIHLFDVVLVMSVEPGFGGQMFIEESKEKIKEIIKYINDEKLPTIIQVDGGINDKNSQQLFKLGSTINVVGSFLIKDIDKKTINKLI